MELRALNGLRRKSGGERRESRAALLTEVALSSPHLLGATSPPRSTQQISSSAIYRGVPVYRGWALALLAPYPGTREQAEAQGYPPHGGVGCFGIGAAQTAFTFGVSLTSAASTVSSLLPLPCGACTGFRARVEATQLEWRPRVGLHPGVGMSSGGRRAWRTACWVTS